MLKKNVLTFTFLILISFFYGLNGHFYAPVATLDNQNDSLVMSRVMSSVFDDIYIISTYDNIIRQISEEEGNDWRLMSAIAYHESRFKPDAISRCGAKGLMQVMPVVARQFDVAVDEIAKPEVNVWLANRLLTTIVSMLKLPNDISYEDRLSITLACYNGGIGHVNDARRLANFYGEDNNSWSSVSKYLKLKKLPEYYENSLVQCGRFMGSGQTLAYVDNVMQSYDKYCLIATR